MSEPPQFRTMRLSGRPPTPEAQALYCRLFGRQVGENHLHRDIQDWDRHRVAPWTLSHAGNLVGIGGFRIGFGAEGFELTFHFVPEFQGQGLASEFVAGALDYAQVHLLAQSVFAYVEVDNLASIRVLEKVDFRIVTTKGPRHRLECSLPPAKLEPMRPTA